MPGMEHVTDSRWHEAAQNLLTLHRPEQAEKLIRLRLAAYPRDSYAYSLLSVALYRQRRLPEAQQAANTAIGLNPKSSEAFYFLSLVQAERTDYKLAEANLRTALQINPLSSKYLGRLAWVLNTLGRTTEAQATAEAGLRYHPSHAECLVQLAHALRAQQHWQLMKATLLRLVEAQPQLSLAYRLLGNEAMRQELFAEAQVYFEDTLRLSPNDTTAHQGLTRALRYQFGPGRVARRINRYLTWISEDTKKGKLQAWGHFLLILLPLSLLCIPLLLFMAFEALYWRLHPQVRHLRNRPTDTPSYLLDTVRRYAPAVVLGQLFISLIGQVVRIFEHFNWPTHALTGGLTAMCAAILPLFAQLSAIPDPPPVPVWWLLAAATILACTLVTILYLPMWGTVSVLIITSAVGYGYLRSLRAA